MSSHPYTHPAHPELEPGVFLTVDAWRVFGMVLSVEPAMIGSDDEVEILLQTDPEDDDATRRFRVAPGQYTLDEVGP